VIAYLDCFSGISGDMLISALIDAGVQPSDLIKGLPFKVEIKTKKTSRSGITATQVDIINDSKKVHTLREFINLISLSEFPQKIREKAINIIQSLFEAEAEVHGKTPEEVHLHELGSIDTIIDILLNLQGFELLGIKKIFCSPVNTGRGYIKTEHGILPVPVPAVAYLLKDFPVFSYGPSEELTTPTGAALLKALAIPASMPMMRLRKIGYGAGSKNHEGWPNILRIFIGEELKEKYEGLIIEEAYIIESNIDDMNPQNYEYITERLFERGALDVFIDNLIMKKSRPGQKLSVLCREESLMDLCDLILRESTTLGIRFYRVERVILPRRTVEFSSSLGRLRLKIAEYKGVKKVIPEYEDIKAIAKSSGLPITEVIEIIKKEALLLPHHNSKK